MNKHAFRPGAGMLRIRDGRANDEGQWRSSLWLHAARNGDSVTLWMDGHGDREKRIPAISARLTLTRKGAGRLAGIILNAIEEGS